MPLYKHIVLYSMSKKKSKKRVVGLRPSDYRAYLNTITDERREQIRHNDIVLVIVSVVVLVITLVSVF